MSQTPASNPAPAYARRVRLGEALVQEGVLTPEQLARALAEQKSSGRMLGEMLVETGVISGAHLVHVLAKTLGVRGCQIRHGLIDPAVFKLVGAEECERLLAIPMFKVHGTLTVATTDPQNLPKIDRIRQLTGCRVRTVLALEANVREFVKKYAAGETSIDAFLTSLSEQDVEVAVQAALTGHLVLATLHTNDAVGACARLLDMGIEPYLLSAAMNGSVAQRLARSICPSCATKYYPAEKELADAGLADKVGRAFRKGGGCQACHDSGFQGRFGVYEVMEETPELRRMVHRAAPSHELRAEFRKSGGRTLRDEGVAAALDGRSSLEEVLRVTTDEDAEAHSGPPVHTPERRVA